MNKPHYHGWSVEQLTAEIDRLTRIDNDMTDATQDEHIEFYGLHIGPLYEYRQLIWNIYQQAKRDAANSLRRKFR